MRIVREQADEGAFREMCCTVTRALRCAVARMVSLFLSTTTDQPQCLNTRNCPRSLGRNN